MIQSSNTVSVFGNTYKVGLGRFSIAAVVNSIAVNWFKLVGVY